MASKPLLIPGVLHRVKHGKMIDLDELANDTKIESKSEYASKLAELQLALLHYQRKLTGTKRSLILVFEGPDAAGKGGIIKRIGEKLDPRTLRVYSIIKPTEEEFAHQYMWRFWSKIPKRGDFAVFDRSWYGRVLVERVEGFATQTEWKRAFDEINNFEQALHDDGTIIIKFYLHISKAEQLRRFRARQEDPYKRWKITEEDWRNRRKWKQHNEAAQEMFALTSNPQCPWYAITTNHKWCARVAVAQTVVNTLHQEIGL